jgi:hypothetical protein
MIVTALLEVNKAFAYLQIERIVFYTSVILLPWQYCVHNTRGHPVVLTRSF